MMNTSDTGRIHRVLVLWLDLQHAMARNGGNEPPPWDCKDKAVMGLWNQITDPKNEPALEEWLFQAAEGEASDWALKALQVSRERRAAKTP